MQALLLIEFPGVGSFGPQMDVSPSPLFECDVAPRVAFDPGGASEADCRGVKKYVLAIGVLALDRKQMLVEMFPV